MNQVFNFFNGPFNFCDCKNSRNTDVLVPVLACQDRVLRVLQVTYHNHKMSIMVVLLILFNTRNESSFYMLQ